MSLVLAQSGSFLKQDMALWAEAVKVAGVKLDGNGD
jgi:hypothetical protein